MFQQAAQGAQNLYQGGGPQVVPFSPQTQQAMQLAQQRATQGSPVNQAANQYATNTLNGQGFMGNPYLDQMFNRAAGAVTNQVQSNFGRSGRNVSGPDAAGFASDRYNDLATQIYGGNYEAERARQQQLVPYAGQLAGQDYQDIAQLAQVGAGHEALAQEYQNQPGLNLDQYFARLSGVPGGYGSMNTPTSRNPLAGALGGATLGSFFNQPWATLGGGILGGLWG
jgi:hypothetical protein